MLEWRYRMYSMFGSKKKNKKHIVPLEFQVEPTETLFIAAVVVVGQKRDHMLWASFVKKDESPPQADNQQGQMTSAISTYISSGCQSIINSSDLIQIT